MSLMSVHKGQVCRKKGLMHEGDRQDQVAAREEPEEEEESEDAACEESGEHNEAAVKAVPGANGTQRALQALLENLCHHCAAERESPINPVDNALALLRDNAALSRAQEKLLLQGRDKSLDVVFRAHISAMVGVLNLYLDPELPYTWKEASMVIVKAQGCGSTCACSIRMWVLDFIREGTLPLHSYGYSRQTVLEDEEVLQEVQRQLSEKAKGGFIKAQDVCDIVATKTIQTLFARLGIDKPSISQSTAQRWLARMDWRYSRVKNGMYIDGHERDDVVAYRCAFVHRWAEYEANFQFWDDNGNPLPSSCPSDLRRLILITHDESTFFQNDERKTCWSHQDSQPTPKPKGEGQSLMVSDFLTAEWGRLRNDNRCVTFFLLHSLFFVNVYAERPASCSKRARTATVTSMQRNLSPKSIAQSTSLRTGQMVPRVSFCSTTHPAT